jgi:signal transduction histidine kinase
MIVESLNRRKKFILVFIVTASLLISYLHYSTHPEIQNLHNVFTELYYLPLILGAFAFGFKGAILTYVFVSILYLPHIIVSWTNDFSFVVNKLLHAVFSGSIALLAGYLVDREKRVREQAEKDRYLAGLGQAAAAIVHDLKNPLISISGFARRIHQGKGNVDTASEVIMNSAEDMKVIVNDVLDFARPVKLKLENVDIGTLIKKAYNYCREKAEKKGVVLSVSMPADSTTIQIDRSHSERALINLINNAIEASEGGKSVDVRAETNEDNLHIKIKDRGAGMDKETLENIFIPFYTRKSYGTGLGMAIAKKIVEGHKGRIHVESQEQQGTEVILELPL